MELNLIVIPGTGLNPTLQFGNVADVAIDDIGNTYITDGDGGVNNRFVKLNQTFGLYYEGPLTMTLEARIQLHGNESEIIYGFADRSHNRRRSI